MMTLGLTVLFALVVVFVRVAVRVKREEEALLRHIEALMAELDKEAGR